MIIRSEVCLIHLTETVTSLPSNDTCQSRKEPERLKRIAGSRRQEEWETGIKRASRSEHTHSLGSQGSVPTPTITEISNQLLEKDLPNGSIGQWLAYVCNLL